MKRSFTKSVPLPVGITQAQLGDDAWVMRLFDELVDEPRCWINAGHVVWFLACCSHARRKARRSPGGLLLRLLQNPQRAEWLDEEADWAEAKRRLERVTSGGGA